MAADRTAGLGRAIHDVWRPDGPCVRHCTLGVWHHLPAMRLESKRASIPTLFLEMGDKVGALLNHPAVEERWTDDSALEGMTIGALAAHLGRAFTTTWLYLQADECAVEDDTLDASSYFRLAFDQPEEDIDALNASIAQRASDDAEPGAAVVRERHQTTVADLRTKLIGEAGERGIEVFGEMCMPLDDYLVTRMVEAVVHSDDLAASIDAELPGFAPDVLDLVMIALLGIARERHGDVAVLREFARAERSATKVLPVF